MKEKIMDAMEIAKIVLWLGWLAIAAIPTGIWFVCTVYIFKNAWTAYRLCAAGEKQCRRVFRWLEYIDTYVISDRGASNEAKDDWFEYSDGAKDLLIASKDALCRIAEDYLKAGAH